MPAPRPPSEPKGPYTVTIYVAAPGAPIQRLDGDATQTSQAGHVYYSVSDGKTENGYGFSPIQSGMRGPGHVVRDEHEMYLNPAYARTMEITAAQYDALRDYGEQGVAKDERYFDLDYNGATNSCIDFTWGALNHAGLHRRIELPLGFELQDKDYDGALKPLDNIREFKRIPDPVPGSPHNREQENALPERTRWQRLLSEDESQRGLDQGSRHAATHVADRSPFEDPVLEQLHAALQRGDSDRLDEIGRQFNRSDEGAQLERQGRQLYDEQQATVSQSEHPQQQPVELVRA
ncbi:hypothetical protein [Luteimonas huabeiensis]|uniref:hypothetical protein n=1 Tax=Luteimonas huabeiensis TaxID=1244513 RepID=UPI0004AC9A5A|nr:hypothetical protein [Luteimonas huabeiensis]